MPTKVTIGIQARSNSKRFPNKVFERLGEKSVLNHVISSCQKGAFYINQWGARKDIFVDIALCVPHDDPITRQMFGQVPIVEGPEEDVLGRYKILLDHTGSDYIVRVTGDCPLIPPFVISKCITTAVMGEYDYISNVDERCRTAPDGFDVEVISKKCLTYADRDAVFPRDREHVTTFIRSSPPPGAKLGTIINFLDLSYLKLSLDTQEDLVRIKSESGKVQDAYARALEIFGKGNVHKW